MKKNQKFWMCLGIVVILIICILALYQSTQKVTYIEYISIGNNGDDILEMYNNDFMIEQEFKIPYQMFQGIGLSIGINGRENNSRYEVIITDKTTNQQLAIMEFNTSQVNENEMYELILDSPIKVDNTHQFSASIKAKTIVNSENYVSFRIDKSNGNTENLYYNGNLCQANLCMNVYGGDSNSFWWLFTLGCEIYIVLLVMYSLYLYTKGKSVIGNAFVQTSLVGIVIFTVMATLSGMETFSDEVDNMIGGMLIKKGRILYVDYYSQHTPFAYFLCAFFAMFQAGSVMQFRLLYYVVIAGVYMGLYWRHKDYFGKIKMALLPILQIIFGLLIAKETVMILSDNIQTICMIALILEFLRYLKDEKLDWGRSIIVSISIFCSFSSAFVSIYAIFAIGLGVLCREILYWKKQLSISLKNMIARYWKLVIACIFPFVLWFGYLMMTHSLVAFYQQAFKFNREVYPYYLEDGFGTNIIQPFFIGIGNFIQVIPNAIQNITSNEQVIVAIVNIILVAIVMMILLQLLQKKEYLKALIISMFISFGFTRTNEDFHTVIAWGSMLTIVILYFDLLNMRNVLRKTVVFGMIIICIGNYTQYCNAYLFKKMEPISALQQKVISETEEGEEIFYDIYSNVSSIYLIYKDRLPINRLGFILPWYMDWYELDTIDDLVTKCPQIVIYDENLKVWEISGYDDYLRKYLHENYEQIMGNEKIWILKKF